MQQELIEREVEKKRGTTKEHENRPRKELRGKNCSKLYEERMEKLEKGKAPKCGS